MNIESPTPVAVPAATPSATSAQAPAAPIISGSAPQPTPVAANPVIVKPRKVKKNKVAVPAAKL
jgi:hypothetical protein